MAIWLVIVLPISVIAAPYAAMVMDARTGEVLHSRNADTKLHPASLTKMMTLYIAFEAVERGEISLDKKVRISSHAASEPPSKLGLRSGQTIALRYLIRAAAVKSANDAATAIGEAISGSEAAFAKRMNRTAKALGMSRTNFKNAHGLTQSGHLSTARDMTILGRHMLYDYPQYYNLFSRSSTHAGTKTVNNTNRRLLANYKGADGIKTGYTRAAGYNLVASAERGQERIIATVFGGKSTVSRNARVAELLDMGFRRAPSRAPLRKPGRPNYAANPEAVSTGGGAGKTIRVSGAARTSLRPRMRPDRSQPSPSTAPVLLADTPMPPDHSLTTRSSPEQPVNQTDIAAALVAAQLARAEPDSGVTPPPTAKDTTGALRVSAPPAIRPQDLAHLMPAPAQVPRQEVVTRLSATTPGQWGVNIGRYTSRYKAEKMLLRTALTEMATLDGSRRRVEPHRQGFDANFLGLSKERAELACRRLNARNLTCRMIGPS